MGRVAKPRSLQGIERALENPLGAERLPLEGLASTPPALHPRHPLVALPLGPFLPGMIREGVLSKRSELQSELKPPLLGEARRHPHVMEPRCFVEETKKERAHGISVRVLVPPESGEDHVDGTVMLDLEHHPLSRLVGSAGGARPDPRGPPPPRTPQPTRRAG